MLRPKPSLLFICAEDPKQDSALLRRVKDLARGFVREGHLVTIVTTSISESSIQRRGNLKMITVKVPVKLTTKRVHKSLRLSLSLSWTLFRQAMKVPQHDIVVSLSEPPLFVVAARMLASFKKSKHIHWCRTIYPDIYPYHGLKLPDWLFKFIQVRVRKAMKSAGSVVTPGKLMSRHLAHTGMETRKMRLIYDWLPPELSVSDEKLEKLIRESSYDIPYREPQQLEKPLRQDQYGQKFRIVYTGRMEDIYPVQPVIEVARILKDSNPEIEFVFIGNGPEYEQMARERAESGLDNIRFLPMPSMMTAKSTFENADLYIMSMKDGIGDLAIPISFATAVAVHRPVLFIGPRQSDIARFIEMNKMGAIASQGDVNRLASLILQYRNDAEAWFSAHEAVQKHAGDRAYDATMKEWKKLVADVVTNRV